MPLASATLEGLGFSAKASRVSKLWVSPARTTLEPSARFQYRAVRSFDQLSTWLSSAKHTPLTPSLCPFPVPILSRCCSTCAPALPPFHRHVSYQRVCGYRATEGSLEDEVGLEDFVAARRQSTAGLLRHPFQKEGTHLSAATSLGLRNCKSRDQSANSSAAISI